MNWLSNLLKKPSTNSAAQTSVALAQVQPTSDETAQLRRSLTAALTQEERQQLVTRLAHSLAERLQAPLAEDAADIWASTICKISDKALALIWVEKLSDEAALSEIATQARSAEVRYAAAKRITSPNVLEQVAQLARNKDKRVAHHCAELLKQHRHAEADARRASEIHADLQRLLTSPPLPHTPLLDLKNALTALNHAGEAGAQCNTLLQQAFAQLRQESEALRDLQLQVKAAQALASLCQHAAWPWHASMTDWQQQFSALQHAHTERPAWLTKLPIASTLSTALAEIAHCLQSMAEQDALMQSCVAFLSAQEAASLNDLPLDEAVFSTWQALAKPTQAAALAELQARWQALNIHAPTLAISAVSLPNEVETVAPEVPIIAPVATTKPPKRERKPFDSAAFMLLLDSLEQNISEGHLIAADANAKQIKNQLGNNSLPTALHTRLHDLQAQLETLRGWARWGTQQAREKLIADAQTLLNENQEVNELVDAIPKLREAWKRLNVHSAASKEQWEIFDAALEQAYIPVAALRAEQAAQHNLACAAKTALCTQWEADWEVHAANIANENADFKVIEHLRSEWIKQWQAAAHASFRDERLLRKRFDSLIDLIDQHLTAVRKAEYRRRLDLIARAEALKEQSDLRLAVAEVKALQQQWTQQSHAIHLKRSEEQKLWTRYRAACNAVFERLNEQRSAQSNERLGQLQARQALLDTFSSRLDDATLRSDIPEIQTLRTALSEFKKEWESARIVPRETDDKLEAKARELMQRAQQRINSFHNEKQHAQFKLLVEKATLIEKIEAAAQAALPLEAVLAETQQAWDVLPALPSKMESLLAKRYATASQITPQQWQTGHAARAALLLDLEIALGLPSPESFAEVRRLRQLDRLQNRFAAAVQHATQPEEEVVNWFAISATPDAAFDQRIKTVINQVIIA